MKIVVLAGGISTERDVSLISGTQIYRALQAKGHQVVLLDLFMGLEQETGDLSDIFEWNRDWSANIGGITEKDPDISKIKAMRKDQSANVFGAHVLDVCRMADIVFLGLHGSNGEDGRIHFYGHAKVRAELARKILRGLKFDNETVDQVTLLVTYHDFPFQISEKGIRRAMNRVGELFPKLLEVCTADSMGKNEHARAEYLPLLEQAESCYRKILRDGDCVSLKSLAVTGSDLIAAGMKPGKELGQCLNRCLEAVLDNPAKNRKETLLKLAFSTENESPAENPQKEEAKRK